MAFFQTLFSLLGMIFSNFIFTANCAKLIRILAKNILIDIIVEVFVTIGNDRTFGGFFGITLRVVT